MLAGGMLSIVLFAISFAAIATMLNGFAQVLHFRARASEMARQLITFNNAAVLYFTQTTSATAGTKVDVATLIQDGQLPAGFQSRNKLGQVLQAVYGGKKQVISMYAGPVDMTGENLMGYKKNAPLNQRAIASAVANYAATYSAGEGNVVAGWTVQQTTLVDLPMNAGSIDIAKSYSAWPRVSYISPVLLNNFTQLEYGSTTHRTRPSTHCHTGTPASPITIGFTAPGAHTYTIGNCPNGATVTVKAVGAVGGAQASWDRALDRESVGIVEASFHAAAGDTLTVIVGGSGVSGKRGAGGGGGGLSGVLVGHTPEVVAYGGGGFGSRTRSWRCAPQPEPGGPGYGGGVATRGDRGNTAGSGAPFGAGGQPGFGSSAGSGGFGGGGAGSRYGCGGGGSGYPGGPGGDMRQPNGTHGTTYVAPGATMIQKTQIVKGVGGAASDGSVKLSIQY